MNKQQEPRLRFKSFMGEWEERVLGKIFEISSASRVLKEQWQKEGVPFFRTSDVVAAFKGESNEEAFISFELFEDLAKKSGRPQKDDLLVTGGGSIGIPFLIQNDQPIYFKDADLLWLKSAGKINGSFLFYYFLSNKFKSYLKSISHTGTISHYTIIQAKFTPITLPSPAEQTHLGLFFRSLDSQIAESRAVLEKSRQLKKAMLAKMFPANGEKIPKIRFKGFEGEWECRKLGDLMNVTSVKRIHQSDWTNEGVRFLRARDIVAFNKGERIEEPLFISKEKYNEYSELSGKVKIGDLLVTGVGTIGVPYLIEDEDPLYFKDGNVIWFQNENKIGGLFFYYSFLNNFIQDFIIETAGIGTVGTYTIDTGKKTPIFLPPTKSEQTAIGLFFRQLDETIALQSAEVEKLNQLKKGLLATMLV